MQCHQQLGDSLEDQLSLASIHYLRGHYQVLLPVCCFSQVLSLCAAIRYWCECCPIDPAYTCNLSCCSCTPERMRLTSALNE